MCERRKLDAKLLLLQEERVLIDMHLEGQAVKQEEVLQAESSVRDKSDMLKSALTGLEVRSHCCLCVVFVIFVVMLICNIQREMEKLRLLMSAAEAVT